MASDVGSIVICDAGPLIHLDELACMDLLALFKPILVPGLVWEEVSRIRPTALHPRAVALICVEADPPRPSEELHELIAGYGLDSGEEHALRLMEQTPGAVLLTDDTDARTVAVVRGLPVHGTLGVILAGFHAGNRTRSQILSLLSNLHGSCSLFVGKSLLQRVIAQVEGAST